MSTEIKNTLFRFITMRAPELLNEKNTEKKFVTYPKQNYDKIFKGVESNLVYQSGFYIDAINTATSNETKKQILLRITKEFEIQSLKSKEEIVENGYVTQSFFDFAIWLTSNRATLKANEVNDYLNEINSAKDSLIKKIDNEIYLWDNLFYQIITFKSSYLRDAIISLLVANFFIKNNILVEQTNEGFRKLAKARVIIPKLIFEKEIESVNVDISKTKKSKDKENSFQFINTKSLDNEMKLILNQQKLELYSKIIDELTNEQKKYNKLNQKAYDEAYMIYENKIKKLYANAKTTDKTIIDPITNEISIIKEYVEFKIPSFEFKKKAELNRRLLSNNVSKETLIVIKSLSTTNYYDSFEEVISYIKQEVNSLTQELLENALINQTLINNNGIIIPVAKVTNDTLNAFTIGGNGYPSPTMSIEILFNDSIDNADVISAEYNIILNGNNPIIKTSFADSIVNGRLAVTLVPETLTMSGMQFVTLNGLLNLSNGNKINFAGTAQIFRSGSWFGQHKFDLRGNGTFKIEIPNIDTDSGNILDYIPSGFGIKRLGIADYRKVEQEICCYVPGEVSHIENIMASEYKERSTRMLRRSENTTTSSQEKETEKLTDTTSADRFEMNQEVASVLSENTSIGANVSVNQSWGTGGINAGADFANNTSSEESNSQALTHAKDITERVLERVVLKVKEERVSKVIEEFEENNKHGYDNRNNKDHVSGVYRWVDKVYRNQVVNYGKRLMYEFMIPEPASFHNAAINESKKNSNIEVLVKPIDPRVGDNIIVLKSHKDITEYNYSHWAGIYNAEVLPMPDNIIYVGKSIAIEKASPGSESVSKNEMIKIDEKYVTTEAKAIFSGHEDTDWTQVHGITIIFGDKTVQTNVRIRGIYDGYPPFQSVSGYKNEFPVSVWYYNFHTGSVNVTVKCELTPQSKQQWQIDTFNTIVKAYETKLSEYNAKVAQAKAMQSEKVRTNPMFYRQIENLVLRKNCIEYLASHETLGAKSMLSVLQDIQNIQVSYNDPQLEIYANKVKFFEQAFEWNLMSYNFYPFYWANKTNWASLYNINETDDAIFRAFLQSGMARVIVTVRPGFEEAVNWYMATGQVWNGGQVPTMDDPLYISIVEELRETTGMVEETWETRVPTSLTIIQAGSVGLQVESGLPCDEDCKDYKLFDSDGNLVVDSDGNPKSNNPFVKSNVTLQGIGQEPIKAIPVEPTPVTPRTK